MSPQETYRYILQAIRTVKILDKKTTSLEIEQNRGWLTRLQFVLLEYPLRSYGFLGLISLVIWGLFFLVFQKVEATNLIRLACFSSWILVSISLFVLLVKLTPKSKMTMLERWFFVFIRFQILTSLKSSEAKRKIKESIKYFTTESRPIYWMICFAGGIFINCLSNSDFWKALLSFSPIKILQSNEAGFLSLSFLLFCGSYYLIKYDLPRAWMQNTLDSIELNNVED
jgi:hypothetical protein